jgi:4-hydroxy 2-oxovalerate aldolase
MLLSDRRYKNFKFNEVIKKLKMLNARKYNPNTFYLAMNFYENKLKKFKANSLKISLKKNVVIFGNGESLKNQDIINKSLIINSTKILINRSNYIKEKMVDIISCCHPIRLIADVHLLKNKKNNLLIPYETVPKIMQKKINSNNLINYNIKLGSKLKLGKNYIQMPKPLSLIYTLGFLISKGVKKIYLAGFDGFEQDDPFKDETQTYINDLKKLSKNLKIISLTKTKLKF